MEFINQNMQIIIAALIILAVLLIVMLVWRAISPRVMGRRGQRLGISEYHEIDKTRRLVLIRRDDVEHLLMIGGAQDLVVESRIAVPSQATSYPPPLPGDAPPPAGVSRSAPRPAVFGDRRPPPLRSVEPQTAPRLAQDRENEPT